jgi:chromosome segregation ATPase
MDEPSVEAGGVASPLDTMTADGHHPDPVAVGPDQSALVEHAVLQSRVAELELRLRERVEENIVLDNEVGCLQKEKLVNHEYMISLQHDAARLPGAERELRETRRQLEDVQLELEEVRSELEAFRSRLSRIMVDRVVVSVRRYPGAYRFGRYVARRMVHSFRR